VVWRIEPFLSRPTAEGLDCNWSIAADQMKRPAPGAHAGKLVPRGADQHVTAKPADIGDHDALPSSRHRIPEYQLGGAGLRLGAGPIRIVADQVIQAGSCNLRRQASHIIEAELYPSRDGVTGASSYGIVKFTLQQEAPGIVQQSASVTASFREGNGGQGLGDSGQQELRNSVTALERSASRVYTLQGPGVTVRPAELSTDDGHRTGFGQGRGEEILQPGNAELTGRLELSQK
jgi:hypothetical protein